MILAPEMLADTIKETVESLLQHDRKMTPQAALYAEKAGGFQCRTCAHSVPMNASHGRCAVVSVTVSLDTGCCAAWTPDKTMLHLYQEPEVV